MQLSLKDRLIKASVQLNDDYPFFAYMVLHLNDGGEIEFDEKIPTACVDARGHLKVNPKWCDQFDYKYLMGLLAHEVGHIAFAHLSRLGRRNPEILNIANDVEINNMLVKNGFSLPAEGIIPSNDEVDLFRDGKIVIKKISEKHSEELYDEIYRKLDKAGMIARVKGYGVVGAGTPQAKGKNGLGSFDQHVYGDAMSEKERKKNAEKWHDKVIEANTLAKARGKEPAGMGRLLDKLNNQQINWRSMLWKYIRSAIPYDFTWKTPSKKSFSTGIYMPGVLKENIEVVVSVDTSGSIGQKELTDFLTEMVAIGTSFRNVEIKILVCDSEIHEIYTLRNGDIQKVLNLKISGGGGTSHQPIVEHINQKAPGTKVLIAFTDGYSDIQDSFKHLPETCDRIIVLSGMSVPAKDMEPYGRVVKVEQE